MTCDFKEAKKRRKQTMSEIADDVLRRHADTFSALASRDITFCSNISCPVRALCSRAEVPGEGWYSVSQFELNEDGSCDYFIKVD